MQHVDAGVEILLKAITSLIGANSERVKDCKNGGEHDRVLKQLPHLDSALFAVAGQRSRICCLTDYPRTKKPRPVT
jgi:hypothetical protein